MKDEEVLATRESGGYGKGLGRGGVDGGEVSGTAIAYPGRHVLLGDGELSISFPCVP